MMRLRNSRYLLPLALGVLGLLLLVRMFLAGAFVLVPEDIDVVLLVVLLSLFGWMGLADYVRAEFLRGRNMDYVRAARALGVSNRTIMWRHLLPNAMTPVITFLPFRVSGAVLALTSLDFLGLGVPPTTPRLGELLSQGKDSIDAWWLSMTTFVVLVGTLMLLIFIGEALRSALDTRQG